MTDHRIFLGVGSNVQREAHIDIALNMLGEHLRDLRCSPVYESESLDGEHPPFFNLVVSATTDLSARELIGWLKEIEELHGRRRGAQSLIALDIDLLLFDDFAGLVDGVRVPRGEILTRAFVLYPLQLLAPQLRHPEFGLSMVELWKQLRPGPALAPVRFQFGPPHSVGAGLSCDEPLRRTAQRSPIAPRSGTAARSFAGKPRSYSDRA